MIREEEKGGGDPGKPSLVFLGFLPLCPSVHSGLSQVTGCGDRKSGWMRVREAVIRSGSYGTYSVDNFRGYFGRRFGRRFGREPPLICTLAAARANTKNAQKPMSGKILRIIPMSAISGSSDRSRSSHTQRRSCGWVLR